MTDGELTVVKVDENTDTSGGDISYSQPQDLEAALENYYGGDVVGYSVKAGGDFFHYAEIDGEWKPVAYSTSQGNQDPQYYLPTESGWTEVGSEEYEAALAELFPTGATPEDQSDSDATVALKDLDTGGSELTFSSLFSSDSLFGEGGGGNGNGGGNGGGQGNQPDLDNLVGGGGEDA